MTDSEFVAPRAGEWRSFAEHFPDAPPPLYRRIIRETLARRDAHRLRALRAAGRLCRARVRTGSRLPARRAAHRCRRPIVAACARVVARGSLASGVPAPRESGSTHARGAHVARRRQALVHRPTPGMDRAQPRAAGRGSRRTRQRRAGRPTSPLRGEHDRGLPLALRAARARHAPGRHAPRARRGLGARTEPDQRRARGRVTGVARRRS